MPEHFFVLLRAERRALGAQQLRNLSAAEREQLLRRRAVALGVDGEDDVVFAQKVVARPRHGRLMRDSISRHSRSAVCASPALSCQSSPAAKASSQDAGRGRVTASDSTP